MSTWKTTLVTVEEVAFDHDLHAFDVYNMHGAKLGTITPPTIEDMSDLIDDLNNGACPIINGWEDGNGNVCTLEGW